MHKRNVFGSILAGAAAGAVAGLFGAGGGMVLIPLLTALTDIKDETIFPTSLSIMLPVCIVTLTASAFHRPLPWTDAVPYLIGSTVGGIAAGFWGQRIPVKWLHRGLGILILWGGVRYLC